MSSENPTLRIGMHGDFAGRDFQVLGRSVLGVDINGETYYWNEFNLEAKTGETATLVFEATERGGEWRLFTPFEPDYPLTAADAALKQVGDQLNLTGVDVRVTLVQTSRVYRVEGRAPEGEQVGSEANYFNAEAGNVMQVVSWTGEEVEFYNGVTLSPGAVERAFNLPPAATPAKLYSGLDDEGDTGTGNYLSAGKFIFLGGMILVFFFIIFGRNISCSDHEAAPVKHLSASLPPLTTGASGTWAGKNYRVTGHAIVEIAETGVIYERNEYALAGDDGLVSLLVCGERPGVRDWTLFTPLTPLVPPTALECAAQKVGDTVNIDGVVATVRALFQSTIVRVDDGAAGDWHAGDVRYGYTAGSEYFSLLVRWDKNGGSFLRGKSVSPGEFTAAFSAPAGK